MIRGRSGREAQADESNGQESKSMLFDFKGRSGRPTDDIIGKDDVLVIGRQVVKKSEVKRLYLT